MKLEDIKFGNRYKITNNYPVTWNCPDYSKGLMGKIVVVKSTCSNLYGRSVTVYYEDGEFMSFPWKISAEYLESINTNEQTKVESLKEGYFSPFSGKWV